MDVPNLYKFSGAEHILSNLTECRLKVSAKNDLNDPFEIRFRRTGLSIERAREHFRSSRGREWAIHSLKENGRPAEMLEEMDSLPEDIVERLAQRFVDRNAHLQEFIGSLLDKALVLSTCATNNHVLLWSHYASKHKGAAMGLDYSWARIPPVPVRYPDSNEIPIFDVLGMDDFEQAQAILTTKGRLWSYEQEYRMLWERTKQGFQDEEGRWFVMIKPSIVKEIVFGCRTSLNDRDAILEALNVDEYAHVKVSEAVEDDNQYRLEVREIDRVHA